jgi:3-oxoacyl-[acyl-carrier-protein] synthase III
MGAGIVGLGLWVPDTVRDNDAWPESFVRDFHAQRAARDARDFTHIEREASRPYDDLFRKHALPFDNDPFKGATRRYIADPDVPTAHGDARAGMRALEDAEIAPEDVDLVLSSAVVQDELVPSNGPAIQHLLGCKRAAGIGVEAYCAGALAQLDLASGLVESGRARFVLCVQSHQLNRINAMDLPASPIFGDASAAFVVGRVPEGRGVTHFVRGGDGSLSNAVTHAFRETPNAVWWRDGRAPVVPGIGNSEQARRLARNVVGYAIETIQELCERAVLSVDQISALISIQPLCWYQAAVAEGLGLSRERVPSTYAHHAHIGGAAIAGNLLEARRLGLLKEGSAVVLYAHGAGVSRFATLLRW